MPASTYRGMIRDLAKNDFLVFRFPRLLGRSSFRAQLSGWASRNPVSPGRFGTLERIGTPAASQLWRERGHM
jgi:hypothetical protein